MKDIYVLTDGQMEKKKSIKQSIFALLDLQSFQTVRDFNYLLPYLKSHLKMFIVSGLFFLVAIGCSVYIPQYIGKTIDSIFSKKGNFESSYAMLIVLFFLKVFCNTIHKLTIVKVGEEVLKKLRKDIIEIVDFLPMKFFDLNSSGRIISRTVNDVNSIAFIFTTSIYRTIGDLIIVFGVLVMLLVLFPVVGAATVLVIITMIFFLYIVSIKLGANLRTMRKYYTKANAYVTDTMGGIDLISSSSLKNQWQRGYNRLIKLYLLAGKKTVFLWSRFPTFQAIMMGLIYCFIIIVFTPKLTDQSISLGSFVTLLFYLSMIFEPFFEISGRVAEMQTAMASMNKIKDILKLKKYPEKDISSLSSGNISNPEIIFKDVSFSYTEKSKIFDRLNLEIQGGKITAIIGRTGSGKTSLSSLICKLYQPQSGNIFINNMKLSEIQKSYLYENLGIVTQQLFLFEDTIRENLRLYNKEIKDEKILEVLESIKMEPVISKLKNGLDEVFSKEKDPFSMGEKQLIVIARMLLKDPQILIFDEATANLDNNTEYVVQFAFQKLFANRTTLIIAHRLSTIKLADNIIVLDTGKVIESGPQKELENSGGAYSHYLSYLKDHSKNGIE